MAGEGLAAAQPRQTPQTVQGLAIIEAVEVVGILLATILAGIDTASGKSYELASGIAITLIGVCTAAALALVARGMWRGRRWTRTPTMLTQLFTGIVGIYLVQGARYDWGIPALMLALARVALLLALAALAGLFAPASLRALNRPGGTTPR